MHAVTSSTSSPLVLLLICDQSRAARTAVLKHIRAKAYGGYHPRVIGSPFACGHFDIIEVERLGKLPAIVDNAKQNHGRNPQ